MTALLAFDNIRDKDEYITITDEMIDGASTNLMKLEVGEKIQARELLIGLVCAGYNDAATALAVRVSGSVDAFVTLMNQKALEIGMNDTEYVDPMGINDSAYTTAYDTMLVAKEFMRRQALLEMSSLPSYEIPRTNRSEARKIHNRNAMISNYTGSTHLNSNAVGMNAGMTGGGGYCVVTSAKKDEMTYICVVMGGSYDEETQMIYSYVVANELINYAMSYLGYRTVISAGTQICTLPIKAAHVKTNEVSIIIDEDVKVYLPYDYLESGLLKRTVICEKKSLTAPVKKGDRVGTVVISYGDEIVAMADMVVAEDIARDNFMYALEQVRAFVTGRIFIAFSICLFVLIFLYVVVFPKMKNSRRNKRRKRYNKNTFY
jgi:D-alanyl-D-alanine carboxypeptidase (penicillin-binding protein 5/6)